MLGWSHTCCILGMIHSARFAAKHLKIPIHVTLMQSPRPRSSQTTPPSLLERIRDHDNDLAWETFCDVYSPLLYDYCRKRGLQANDAADVVQESLLRVAKAILKFEYDPQRGRFRDWLYRIVHNEICRQANRRKPSVALSQSDEEVAIEQDPEWNEHFHNHILRTALARIRPRFEAVTWDAFVNVWLKHKAASDVATQMGRSLDFVYLSKSRVIKRLRLEVEQLADEAGLNHGKLS